MNVILTTNIQDSMMFPSFGAATEFGNTHLGEGTFKVDGKGGIRIVTTNTKISHYVKETK